MGAAASAAAAAAPKAQLRVVGLGDPVTDVLVNVDAGALQYLAFEPGSCTAVRSPPSGPERLNSALCSSLIVFSVIQHFARC
jgi:hypothetical protein